MVGESIETRAKRPPPPPYVFGPSVFRFPRDQNPQTFSDGVTPGPVSGSAGDPLTIVVVDDQPDTLDAVCSLLELLPRPLRVLPFSSPRAAIDACRQTRVDLLITDLHMPELDGFEAWTQIRQVAPGVVGLLLTADPDEQVVDLAEAKGFSAFARKPFEPSALLDLIGALTVPA